MNDKRNDTKAKDEKKPIPEGPKSTLRNMVTEGKTSIKEELKKMAKTFLPALLADAVGLASLKHFFEKKAGSGSPGIGSEKINVNLGGFFSESDETSYLNLMAQLEGETNGIKDAVNISSFMNKYDHGKIRRFRVQLANLAELSHSLEPKKEAATAPVDGSIPIIKEAEKNPLVINPALRFLKFFAALDDNGKMTVLKTAGTLTSNGDIVQEACANLTKTVIEARKTMRQSKPPEKFPKRKYRGVIGELFSRKSC